MQRRVLAHQLFNGIDRIEPPRPEVLVVPRVFADGNGQPHSIEFHHPLFARGCKVTLLVENVVERQQPLVLLQQQSPAIQQHGCIHCRLAASRLGRKSHTGQNRRGKIDRCGGQLVNRSAAARQEARFFKEVRGRIAAHRQLGKHSEARALPGGTSAGCDDFFEVPLKIPNRGIDLG